MKRSLFFFAAALAVAALSYLSFWPTSIDPIAVPARPDAGFIGPYAINDALRGGERMFVDEVVQPGGLALDPSGNLHVATGDGRVLRLMADGRLKPSGLAGGRALGFAMGRDRQAVLAEPARGLVVARKSASRVLASEAGGKPLRFPVDVALGLRSGDIYFTDASDTHGEGKTWAEFVEMRPRGRLLATNDLSTATRVLLDGLYFPAGLALAPDESYLLICEATAFRVLRYWLRGEKAGTHEVFIDALPGYPFGLSSNGRGLFWLSVYAPRIAALERLGTHPFLRQALFRLPRAWQPKPAPHAIVLGLNETGRVRHNLQHSAPDAYAPVTDALEHGGWLYLASPKQNGLLRFAMPASANP